MIKYRIGKFGIEIERHEVIRETDKCVFLPGLGGRERKENKESEYGKWFDTWAEAYSHLLSRVDKNYDRAGRNLVACRSELETVKAMVNPETAQ